MKEKINNLISGIKRSISNTVNADKMHHNTGLISIIVSLVLLLVIYLAFANVDLAFMQGDEELYRMENVGIFSSLEISDEEAPDLDGMSFTYTSGEATKTFSDGFEFRFEICKTVLLNFVTFKWEPADQVIILTAK